MLSREIDREIVSRTPLFDELPNLPGAVVTSP
jgi:hypothetical protein